MLELLLLLWIVTAVVIIWEKRIIKMVLWLALSSFLGSVIFLFLGSPDVAMAEAAISAFSTIFFVVCLEKYLGIKENENLNEEVNERSKVRFIVPAIFTIALAGLFIYFSPVVDFNTYLKDLYIQRAGTDVGGDNVIGAIYLGYRVYDTLFEALMLVVSVVAVIHMSEFAQESVKDGKHSEIEKDGVAIFLMRIVAPVTVLFGLYVIANGFLTAGGGFQGGLAVAAFFVCRYMVYNIYDIDMHRVGKMEEMVFAGITIMATMIVFQGSMNYVPAQYLPLVQTVYLILMNFLIGMKVACGFLILFYRYIAMERN